MKALLTFPFLPRSGARLLQERPRWLGPFILLAVLHVALRLLAEDQNVRDVLAHLPPSATAADRAAAAASFSQSLPSRLLFLPVRLLIGWSVFAGTLYLFIRSLAPAVPVTFVRVLALEVHAEPAMLLGAIGTSLGALLVPQEGMNAVRAPLFSVAAFVQGSFPPPVVSLLATLNCFTLWYVVLLATGIRVLFGMTMRTAAVIAAAAWALSVLFDTGFLSLLIGTFSFHF
jgi:hypothetical protein